VATKNHWGGIAIRIFIFNDLWSDQANNSVSGEPFDMLRALCAVSGKRPERHAAQGYLRVMTLFLGAKFSLQLAGSSWQLLLHTKKTIQLN
jgi:hypothetical protein